MKCEKKRRDDKEFHWKFKRIFKKSILNLMKNLNKNAICAENF